MVCIGCLVVVLEDVLISFVMNEVFLMYLIDVLIVLMEVLIDLIEEVIEVFVILRLVYCLGIFIMMMVVWYWYCLWVNMLLVVIRRLVRLDLKMEFFIVVNNKKFK